MRQHRKFTVIEALVILAIIGILAGMILPAFASANRKSKEVKAKQAAVEAQKSDRSMYKVTFVSPSGESVRVLHAKMDDFVFSLDKCFIMVVTENDGKAFWAGSYNVEKE